MFFNEKYESSHRYFVSGLNDWIFKKMKDKPSKPRYFVHTRAKLFPDYDILYHIAYKDKVGETVCRDGDVIICFWFWEDFLRLPDTYREIKLEEAVLLS